MQLITDVFSREMVSVDQTMNRYDTRNLAFHEGNESSMPSNHGGSSVGSALYKVLHWYPFNFVEILDSLK